MGIHHCLEVHLWGYTTVKRYTHGDIPLSRGTRMGIYHCLEVHALHLFTLFMTGWGGGACNHFAWAATTVPILPGI